MNTQPAVVLGDLNLSRPLALAGIPVILATVDPDDVSLRSRSVSDHVVVAGYSRDKQADTVAALRAVAARYSGRLPLIYGTDSHVDMLYRHRQALEEHFLFILNDEENGWAMLDKEQFSALCARRGILAPATVAVNGADDVEVALAGLREPLLIKPRRKTGWRELQTHVFDGSGKARIFETRAQLLAHASFRRYAQQLLVQEHLGSDAGAVYSFHAFADASGQLLGSFCGRKIRTYPLVNGESACIELVQVPDVDEAGHDVVAKLGIRGPLKIDFIRDDRTGRLYTLEINCRFTLWNYLGAKEGVNLPAIACHYLLSGASQPEARPATAGAYKWVAFYNDFKAFRELHRAGQLGVGTWIRTVVSPYTLDEIFAWDDPMPAATWLWRMVAGRFSR